MRKYLFHDGFVCKVEDGYMSANQIKANERDHGDLIYVDDGKIIIPTTRNAKNICRSEKN